MIVVIGVIVGYSNIKHNLENHLLDYDIHVNDKTHKILTIEEYKNLLQFSTTVKYEFPTIEKNEERIINLEKADAVHQSEYENIYNEHEGLEGKLSREVNNLNDKINSIHD